MENFSLLSTSVTLGDLRSKEREIRSVAESLLASHGGSLYFPFAISSKRPLRPTQGYLAKFPQEIVDLFPALEEVEKKTKELRESLPSAEPVRGDPGIAYRPADEQIAVSTRDPFTVDPALVERALYGHASTQNALAASVRGAGFEPRSPRAGEPNFDLCWRQEGVVNVAEVKSLSEANEEKQLRLGLGQVLRYRHLLSKAGAEVRAVLAVERQPRDSGWEELCEGLGVRLTFPGRFEGLFEG